MLQDPSHALAAAIRRCQFSLPAVNNWGDNSRLRGGQRGLYWMVPVFAQYKSIAMAKAFTKTQTATTLADMVGITRKHSDHFHRELAMLAHRRVGNSFNRPGLGKFELVNRKPHMRRS
jgi:hypothetical protein